MLSAPASVTMPQIKLMFMEFHEDMKSMMQELVTDLQNASTEPLQDQVRSLTKLAESTTRHVDEIEIPTQSELISSGTKTKSMSTTTLQEDIITSTRNRRYMVINVHTH